MTKRELINLLEARTDIPDDAQIRVTKPTDIEQSVNAPATEISFHEIGPLLYVEIV